MSESENNTKKFDRRSFLKKTGKGVGIALGASIVNAIPGHFASAAENNQVSKKTSYPFTLGIASGDPLPDGVVLWTRLAQDPLNGGGMPDHPIPVHWEVALDSDFRKIVKRGTELSKPQMAHSIHVEVDGLESNSWYYYRFSYHGDVSPVGRTKTAPAYGSAVNEIKFAFASCQNWETGFFTAYQHMAKEDLDFVVHLGDYIYEGVHQSKVRPITQSFPEIYSLEDYRNRYALYKLDSDLQAAHANFPWIVTFDDHEVDNNWAGDIPQDPDKQAKEDFLKRRSFAFQAYYEHMPLRRSSFPNGDSIQLYRRLTFGNLLDINALDTRQFRDDQANGDGWKVPSPESLDPNRTMLGEKQERWLLDGLADSQAKWKVLAQQVFFARRDYDFDPGEEYVSMDAWDGYPVARQRIVDFLAENNILNTVVLTGDVHTNWANEVKVDFNDPNSKNVAVEFVGTSITSNGNGSDVNNNTPQILAENPYIKFFNNRRGYVRCNVTQQNWQTDYLVVPYVTRPGAQITNRASFIVEDRKAALTKVAEAQPV